MRKCVSSAADLLLVLLLGMLLAFPQDVVGQNHVVTSSDLQKDATAVSASREKNRAQVESFLSSQEAQEAMKSAHMDSRQVKNAVAQLNDDELARLSARSAM